MIKSSSVKSLLFVIFLVQHLSAVKNTNVTEEDRGGLVGAILQHDLIYKTVIACEGQKLYIDCPNIYHRIQVQATFYGREDTITCKHPELPSDKICAEQNTTVKDIVVDLCQGESKCEVSATNDFLAQFGSIICPNVYKYLYVRYRCVPKQSLPEAPGLSPYEHATSMTSSVTTNYAPLQCCYEVPAVSTSQRISTVGGTIVTHKEGAQSVEERIVSERPQAAANNTNNVTEMIHTYPTYIPSAPANIPLARISQLPGASRLKLSTLQHGRGHLGTHLVTVGSPQTRGSIKGLKKRNGIARSQLHLNIKALRRIRRNIHLHEDHFYRKEITDILKQNSSNT